MVAYSFKKQFIKPIQLGQKAQTIRGMGKRRHANQGDMLQLYTAMRTKQCRKIVDDVVCVGQHAVVMHFERGEIISIDVDGVQVVDLDAFAAADGFEDVSAMAQFWAENHFTGEFTGASDVLALIKWRASDAVARARR